MENRERKCLVLLRVASYINLTHKCQAHTRQRRMSGLRRAARVLERNSDPTLCDREIDSVSVLSCPYQPLEIYK